MAAPSIRVLVVDDSPLMREMISDVLGEAPGLEVAGVARDGREALAQVDALKPDVVTLDVQMPGMDGLATLSEILARAPIPVIMVSALTQLGATTTLEALEIGALDYVAKPEGAAGVQAALREELVRKIRVVAGVNVPRMLEIRRQRNRRVEQRRTSGPPPARPPRDDAPPPAELADKCIAVGISTGGPPALTTLFEGLAPPLPPIVVVQHMPAQFTKAFAWRLNSISKLEVKEAAGGDLLTPNHVYIAPGGQHLHVVKRGRGACLDIRDGENVSGHKPSVDVMMRGVAEVFRDRSLGLIMTGMGRDGADGCGLLRAAGGYVLGQDEASSDVYGMNKVAMVEGHVDRQFSLDEAAQVVTQHVRRNWLRALAGV